MDKKNFTIGGILLVAALGLMFFGPKSPPPTAPAAAPTAGATAAPNPATTSPATPAVERELAVVNRESPDANVSVLANEYIEARLTDFGGAIRDVAFKKHPAVQGAPDPYVFNRAHADPILAFAETDFHQLGKTRRYEIVSASPSEVVFRTVLDGMLEVTRRYRLAGPGEDPYRIHHETTFRNLASARQALPRVGLSIGTATLMNSQDYGQFLNVARYDGEDSHYTDPSELEAGWFSGAAKTHLALPGQTVWAAVKNQFFTSIYTAEKPGVEVIVRRVDLPPFPDSARPNIGVAATTRFELPALEPNATTTLKGVAYVGPLEYRRIEEFENKEDRVFPFFRGFNAFFLSGFVSPMQNLLLNKIHGWTGNWGVAVILMTLVLKLISLPFTLKASKSAKQMSKLQPELQQIREKFKDNPQKQQMATMELFKKHRVNPIGSCIPILITMPLFIGFFAMLQSPPELRFQSFLWAKDLAAPDTVGHLFGIAWLPINIMPVLMGATMIIQMRLTPTPSVDNMQMKMMQFMPIIFTIFCYNFSCALSLYSTVNGVFTIIQQIIVNRTKDEPGPASPGTAAATTAAAFTKKKGLKNVTPKKK